jgi:hypothetical protein
MLLHILQKDLRADYPILKRREDYKVISAKLTAFHKYRITTGYFRGLLKVKWSLMSNKWVHAEQNEFSCISRINGHLKS